MAEKDISERTQNKIMEKCETNVLPSLNSKRFLACFDKR